MFVKLINKEENKCYTKLSKEYILEVESMPKILISLLKNANDAVEIEVINEEFNPETYIERNTSIKWRKILDKLIKEKYKNMDDSTYTKSLSETLYYTVSCFNKADVIIRANRNQLVTILNTANTLSSYFKKNMLQDEFYNKIVIYMDELSSKLVESIGKRVIVVNKNVYSSQTIKLFTDFRRTVREESIDSVYIFNYGCSLLAFSKLSNFYNCRYRAKFETTLSKVKFYTPDILMDTVYEDEWEKDMKSLMKNGVIPNSAMIEVIETGYLEDFCDKSKELLCGLSLLETCRLSEFYMNKLNKNKYLLNDAEKYKILMTCKCNKVCAKCDMPETVCKTRCFWGASDAITRLI